MMTAHQGQNLRNLVLFGLHDADLWQVCLRCGVYTDVEDALLGELAWLELDLGQVSNAPARRIGNSSSRCFSCRQIHILIEAVLVCSVSGVYLRFSLSHPAPPDSFLFGKFGARLSLVYGDACLGHRYTVLATLALVLSHGDRKG